MTARGPDEQLEVERSYAVDADWNLPGLGDIPDVQSVDDPVESVLDAVYLDTPDLALLRSGTTLRRRTGGRDAGWHLKLPVGEDRLEVRQPLGEPESVPAELLALTRARRRGRELQPVVRIRNRRVARVLRGPGGELAEVTDDHVTAEPLDGGPGRRWREVEVELLGGGRREHLDAVEGVLLAAGARTSPSRSKLGRALADRLPAAADRSGPDGTDPAAPAAEVARAYLAGQVEQLTARDPAVRRDEPDAVHKMRVATRRLRSALATFRPLLDRARTEPVRDELKWLAGVLGAARDAEVMRERLGARARAEPPELLLGPVLRRLDDDLGAGYRAALAEVRTVLDGDRYLRLLESLDALLADAPTTGRGGRAAGEVLPRLVRKEWRRVRDRMGSARAGDGAFTLHDARKAAKRARYAAEAVAPSLGRDAARFAARMEDVQELLGEHQDALTAQAELRRLGVQAHLAGENGFSFGRLHGLEQARAESAVARLPRVWAASSRRKWRRWFR